MSTLPASRTWQRVVLVCLAVYPAVMIAIATVNGPGISVDSVSYAAGATNFAESGRLLTYDGSALTLFPPGLSVLLGAGMWLGLSTSFVTVALNIFAAVVPVLATYFLARQVLISPAWALIAAAAVSLLAATVRVGSYLWTEPLFTALLTWLLVLLAWAVRTKRADWWIPVTAGVLVALATTLRYVGVIAVPVVALAMVWAARDKRITKAALAAAIGLLGLVAVGLRNLSHGSPLLGERYPGSVGVQGAFIGLVEQWGEYVAPARTTSLTIIVGVLVLVLIALGSWLVLVNRNGAGIVLALFVAIYWIAIVFSQVGTRLDVVTERFGAPALAPTVVLVLVALRSVLVTVSHQVAGATHLGEQAVHRALAGILGAVGIAILGLSVFHAVDFVRDGHERGLDLASSDAAARQLSVFATSIPADAVLASNDPWQVWWVRGGIVLDYPPSRMEWPSERVEADLDALTSAVEEHGSVLALIDDTARASATVDDLQRAGLVVSPIERTDGVLVAEITAD